MLIFILFNNQSNLYPLWIATIPLVRLVYDVYIKPT